MGETYFDLLPEEINELIIINLDPDEIYGFKDVIPYIDVNNTKFWDKKIQYDFPWTNMDFVPPQFYTYAHKPLQFIEFQYKLLKSSYNDAESLITEREVLMEEYNEDKMKNPDDYPDPDEYSWRYNFENINNIDVLVMWDKLSYQQIDQIIKRKVAFIDLTISGNGTCKVRLDFYGLTIEYDVSIKEMFNISQHIYLNGGNLILH